MARKFRKIPSTEGHKRVNAARTLRIRRLYRARMIALLGGKCTKCDSIDRLYFSYIGKERYRDITPMNALLCGSWEGCLRQKGNYTLLCNLHSMESRRARRLLQGVTHGMVTSYYRGCRCGLCKNANRLRQRELTQARRSRKKAAMELLKTGKLSFLKRP